MSATVETKIWMAIKARIATLSIGLPIAYPKQNYEPASGAPWINIRHIPNRNARPFYSSTDPSFRQGTTQLELMMPLTAQASEADIQYAGQIAAHFWGADPAFYFEGVKVVIQRAPDVGQPIRDNGWMLTPVTIRWECFA